MCNVLQNDKLPYYWVITWSLLGYITQILHTHTHTKSAWDIKRERERKAQGKNECFEDDNMKTMGINLFKENNNLHKT